MSVEVNLQKCSLPAGRTRAVCTWRALCITTLTPRTPGHLSPSSFHSPPRHPSLFPFLPFFHRVLSFCFPPAQGRSLGSPTVNQSLGSAEPIWSKGRGFHRSLFGNTRQFIARAINLPVDPAGAGAIIEAN